MDIHQWLLGKLVSSWRLMWHLGISYIYLLHRYEDSQLSCLQVIYFCTVVELSLSLASNHCSCYFRKSPTDVLNTAVALLYSPSAACTTLVIDYWKSVLPCCRSPLHAQSWKPVLKLVRPNPDHLLRPCMTVIPTWTFCYPVLSLKHPSHTMYQLPCTYTCTCALLTYYVLQYVYVCIYLQNPI